MAGSRKHPRLRSVRMAAASLRLIPHILILLWGSARGIVRSDMLRWAEILGLQTPDTPLRRILVFVHLMTFTPEFRTVFYVRIGRIGWAFSWMCPRMRGLSIVAGSIGPGLFIQHGNSTFITASSIGANCWIGRHVVVGYSNDTDTPTIGNNVRIFTGAKIIGDITLGDNVTVGLNTVVTQSVAPGLSVLGVPSKVIWRSGNPPSGQGAGV